MDETDEACEEESVITSRGAGVCSAYEAREEEAIADETDEACEEEAIADETDEA